MCCLTAGLCCYSHEELPPTFPTLRSLWTDPGPGPTTADGLFFLSAQKKNKHGATWCSSEEWFRLFPEVGKNHDSQIHSVVEMNSSVWLTLDRVYFFNQGSPNRGTEGDRNLPVTRGGKGIHSSHGATLFFAFNLFPKSVESEQFVCFFTRQPPPAEVVLLPSRSKSELSSHGEKVWFPLQTVTHRGQRSGQNLSDYSFRRRQLQLHVHLHHRYVSLVKMSILVKLLAWPLTNVCWMLTFSSFLKWFDAQQCPNWFFGTAACLDWPDISFILYSATFCFSCLVFLDNVSLQTITSTPTHPLFFLPLHLIPHSSHPHSNLLYHLCVPRGMAGPVACTLVFSFFALPLSSAVYPSLRAWPPTCD